ncbi:DoxX family protein [Gangjinia marincola]|uniref:DoxX family protein n=1 Tax=Gangjinia marincola TaxID=578463 RepID=A0ABN1MJN6_9FLAO
MRGLVNFARLFVGVLFIFSGFIKLNDPLGFSYKLQEYFSADVLGLEFLIPFALAIAVVLVIFEILVGIMLLLGYAKKFTLISLLLMIVFFTFLTFFSAYFEKVTDCGCFGDAIPLTPWQSFYKDIILLGLIVILVVKQKYINPILVPASHKWIVFAATILCMALGYYVLMHLPVIDFRAYKIGSNIAENMKVPPDAQEAIYEYEWTFMVDGEEEVFTTNGSYPEVDGEFIGVETFLIEEGYLPPIRDFSIEKNGEQYTAAFLEKPKLLLLLSYDLSKAETPGWPGVVEQINNAKALEYEIIGLTASGQEEIDVLKERYDLDITFYATDEKVLKTMVRSNPALMTLEQGTVMDKVHWNDAEKLKL